MTVKKRPAPAPVVEVQKPQQTAAIELVQKPSAALVAAVERVRSYRGRPVSESTERAYKGEWGRFQAWAAANGTLSVPAPPEVVCAYLEALAEEGYSAATIVHSLSAITRYHRAEGFDFRRNAPVIAETLDRIRRNVGLKQIKKAPLGLSSLKEICGRLYAQELSGDLKAARDRALLLTGWFCMLRSANLVTVRRNHVRFVKFVREETIDEENSPEGVIIHLPGSKTDQRKVGRDIGVHAQEDETVCPARSLLSYLKSNKFSGDDLIFPISKRTVVRLVKRLVANPDHGHRSLEQIEECDSCSILVNRYGSHSLRRGSATALAQKGAEEREIMRQGGWKSERVARGYIDDAVIFQNNPTKNLTKIDDEKT